jgi:hypothetical protein
VLEKTLERTDRLIKTVESVVTVKKKGHVNNVVETWGTGNRLIRRKHIAFAVLTVLFGLIVFASLERKLAFTTSTRTYATIQQAVDQGVVAKGWLPAFLPTSSRDIREKRNFEQNLVLAAFEFDPGEDLSPLLQTMELAPQNVLEASRPSPIGQSTAWFPTELINGQFQAVAAKGFRFYQAEETVVGVTCNWFLALNARSGLGYLWLKVAGVRSPNSQKGQSSP